MSSYPPPFGTFDGHLVRWSGWTDRPAVRVRKISCCRRVCDVCWGFVQPLPGETMLELRISPTGVERRVAVPAWPILQLIGYRCPICRRTRVFDMGPAGGRFDEIVTRPTVEQLSLLELEP